MYIKQTTCMLLHVQIDALYTYTYSTEPVVLYASLYSSLVTMALYLHTYVHVVIYVYFKQYSCLYIIITCTIIAGKNKSARTKIIAACRLYACCLLYTSDAADE